MKDIEILKLKIEDLQKTHNKYFEHGNKIMLPALLQKRVKIIDNTIYLNVCRTSLYALNQLCDQHDFEIIEITDEYIRIAKIGGAKIG